jgi:hypothetical protein
MLSLPLPQCDDNLARTRVTRSRSGGNLRITCAAIRAGLDKLQSNSERLSPDRTTLNLETAVGRIKVPFLFGSLIADWPKVFAPIGPAAGAGLSGEQRAV